MENYENDYSRCYDFGNGAKFSSKLFQFNKIRKTARN